MKYKVGDRVRIGKFTTNHSDKKQWQGKVMTIWAIQNEGGNLHSYVMKEDNAKNSWYESTIEGLAEQEPDPKPKKPTMTEIYRLAINTYGEDEQCRMIQEEMSELSVALSKFHREPCAERFGNVQEEIADVCIMMQQAKMMFEEKEVDKIIQAKTDRLHERLKDKQAIEVVTGKHSINDKPYTWINPDNATVEVGSIAIAETSKGHMPIIVTHIHKERLKEVKHHKKIVVGGLND